jgi:hypothetical protein
MYVVKDVNGVVLGRYLSGALQVQYVRFGSFVQYLGIDAVLVQDSTLPGGSFLLPLSRRNNPIGQPTVLVGALNLGVIKFTGADCSGTPYSTTPQGWAFDVSDPDLGVGFSGAWYAASTIRDSIGQPLWYYVPTSGTGVRNVSLLSVRQPVGGACTNYTTPSVATAWLLEERNISALGTPPFTVTLN